MTGDVVGVTKHIEVNEGEFVVRWAYQVQESTLLRARQWFE